MLRRKLAFTDTCGNEVAHGNNTTTWPDRRNSDRGSSGRAGALGACAIDRFDGARGLNPRHHLVRILPYVRHRAGEQRTGQEIDARSERAAAAWPSGG